MKTYIKENIKYFLITILVLICWFSLHFIYPHIIELILNNLEKLFIFLFFLGILHFIKLIIKKDFIGIRNTLLTLLIIFLFIYFVPILSCQKKELPDGTLMSRNRFNGQISLKMPNNEFTHFQKDNPFYKEILDLFNNY